VRRPRFIAEQARHARGVLGRIIAFIMSRETWRENLRAIEALDIQPSDHVLDLGCGHGRGLTEIATRATHGRVAGADPSELMAEMSIHRSRTLVRAGLVDVVHAGVEQLPYANATFDKVLCVHVVYFWGDLGASFREIARVLKPGGRLVLVFRTAANKAGVQAFPVDVYRFPELKDVIETLATAGLDLHQGITDGSDEATAPVLVAATCRIVETERPKN
jgi:ubiquinone/menaquinone biosynthesis C-methylase UbiE